MGFFDIFKASKIKTENEKLKQQITLFQNEIVNLDQQLNICQKELSVAQKNYNELSEKIDGTKKAQLEEEICDLTKIRNSLNKEINQIKEYAKKEKQENKEALHAIQIKITAANNALKAIQKVIREDTKGNPDVPEFARKAADMVVDVGTLNINCLDVPNLRKLITANKSNVKKVVQKYESRYTTKANQTIYQLMVLALEAEIQNVLLNLRFGSLDKSKNKISDLCKEYYNIAVNGNQSIAPTIKKFINEIEVLYLEEVEIEYEYYAQRERIKEEQKAIKEQMKQEAEERRQLEQQQKQIEKEELKYKNEIDNVRTYMLSADESELEKLQAKIAELTKKLSKVEEEKEQIISLQNGQAGYVYIISNIGSFGENIFKIGMTRRLDPQERVDELGNASVPFPFDVHSFIFSEKAVELENNIHKILDEKRVNKINKRKEFFSIDINEIETLIHKIDPAAEFKLTALAEQYRQSIELSEQ